MEYYNQERSSPIQLIDPIQVDLLIKVFNVPSGILYLHRVLLLSRPCNIPPSIFLLLNTLYIPHHD